MRGHLVVIHIFLYTNIIFLENKHIRVVEYVSGFHILIMFLKILKNL